MHQIFIVLSVKIMLVLTRLIASFPTTFHVNQLGHTLGTSKAEISHGAPSPQYSCFENFVILKAIGLVAQLVSSEWIF
jgi:hypothetical protein